MDIELYNSTSENGNYNYVKTLPASEYNDIDAYALNGIKQYYKVRLKSGESYSDYSNAVEVENDIKSIRVTQFTKNNLNLLHLTSVGNIELHRADQGDGDYQLLKTMTKEEYWEHDGIVIEEDNQNYFYKVRLYKKYGEITLYSSFTNTISFN